VSLGAPFSGVTRLQRGRMPRFFGDESDDLPPVGAGEMLEIPWNHWRISGNSMVKLHQP